jgi:transcriptional regulator with XRE-family HTH domain
MRTALDQYIIDEIRKRRNAINMSQEQLFQNMGFKSDAFIAATESPRSTKKYNIAQLNKVAIIFNCSLWDLIPEKSFPDNTNIKPLK